MKTSELTGPALAYAVGVAEGCKVEYWHTKAIAILFPGAPRAVPWNPHANWAQGGPIIEREAISVIRADNDYGVDADGFCNNVPIPVWVATTGHHSLGKGYDDPEPSYCQYESDVMYGHTPLIAAMRCYCASKLGDEIEIPEELK